MIEARFFWSRRRPRALVSLVLSLASRSAFADEGKVTGSQEEPGERDVARASFQKGLGLLDAARYVEALDCFRHAYALWANPKILVNMGTTLRALGQNAEAAAVYTQYLQAADPEDPHKEQVAQAMQELSPLVGRVTFSSLEGIERVSIDGSEVSIKPDQSIWVEIGEHTVVAERRAAPPELRRLNVGPAEVQRIDWGTVGTGASFARSDETAASGVRGVAAAPREGSTFSALARADIDTVRFGAVGAAGVAIEAAALVRVTAGALIGAQKGAWLGLEVVPFVGRVRPTVGVSAPVFFAGAAYPGVSFEVGARVFTGSRFTPFARAAVAHFPRAPAEYVSTLFVPSAGLEVSL